MKTTFSYEALSRQGKKEKGILEVESREEALQILSQREVQPLHLENIGEKKSALQISKSKKLSSSELLFFCEELAESLEGGLQIENALQLIQQGQASPPVQAIANELRNQVREGVSLSNAMRQNNFNELLCTVVEAGEQSGHLAEVLRKQIHFMQTLNDLKSRLLTSLIYPSFLIVSAIILIALFVGMLAPQLGNFISKTGGKLPLMTQILINLGSAISHYWILEFIFATGLAFSLAVFFIHPRFRSICHRLQLQMPIFGRLFRFYFMAHISHTLGTLMSSELPLLKSLKLVKKGLANQHLEKEFEQTILAVEDGASLHRAMLNFSICPRHAIDIIRVGEETGNLSPALLKVAQRSEKDLNKWVQRLITIIPTVIIIIMAIVVGIVAFAVVDGIYRSLSEIKFRS